MFKQVVDAVRQMLFLLRDVEQNKEAIATLKEQLAETNELVRAVVIEVQRNKETEQHERENWCCGWKTPCSALNVCCRPNARSRRRGNWSVDGRARVRHTGACFR